MLIKRIYNLLPLAVLAFGLALTGCDSSDSEEEIPSIGGMYAGTDTEEGVLMTFTLDIPETESGAFTLGSDSEISADVEGLPLVIELDGTGTYDYPDITMTMSYELLDEEYVGQVNGTVSSSGDILRLEDSDGEELSFTRQ